MTLVPLLALLAAQPVHRFALVVGSNVGEGIRAAPLKFADDDALAMHELLLEAGVESVLLAEPDPETRRLHPATAPLAPPTIDALRGAFAAQRASMLRAQEAGEAVEWLFFFSGHGDVEQGVAFLGLERGKLTRPFLHDELLSRAPALTLHVVLDACRSGALVGSKGPGGVKVSMPAAFTSASDWPVNAGFVVSSSASRNSHEWEKLQAGVFSYEVRSALRGAADADRDGAISYAELGAFLESANGVIENSRLRPEFLAIPPRGRAGLPAALLSWSTQGVEAAVGEHVYVERPNGERLVDLHFSPGAPASLRLPSTPLFLRSADERREVALAPGIERVAALEPVVRAVSVKGAADQALERLFSAAFGPDAVERYAGAWREPELKAFEVPGPSLAVLRTRGASVVGLAVGAVATATGFVFAWSQRPGLDLLDQRMRAARNELVTVGNGLGVAGLVLTGLSLATFIIVSALFDVPVVPLFPSAE